MKKGLKIGIIVLVVIMGCGIIFGSIDKKRALDNKRPIFVVRTTIYKFEFRFFTKIWQIKSI